MRALSTLWRLILPELKRAIKYKLSGIRTSWQEIAPFPFASLIRLPTRKMRADALSRAGTRPQVRYTLPKTCYHGDMSEDSSLPHSDRAAATAAGHWVLARAGKRVLRPGGLKLTNRMLEQANIHNQKVVEFAPGLGRTASIIIDAGAASYIGVEQDPDAVSQVAKIVTPSGGTVIHAPAQQTPLETGSAHVVVGEAMLTMQGDKGKNAIIFEAFRLLEPGGRYAIHELGLQPNDIAPRLAENLRKRLAQTIRVNARPLTEQEWRTALERAGFTIEWVGTEPMSLLSVRRNLADEGIRGTLRIAKNLLRDKEVRERVRAMREVFNEYANQLTGIAIVARKPEK